MAPRPTAEVLPMSESNGIPDTNVLFGDISSIVSSPLTEIHVHDALKRAVNATAKSNTTLLGDENPNFDPSRGAAPAASFNNKGFLALFALLGAAMVLASIWFFFWAKNGGFHFQEGDWDDYKSTVLRRKGPDGRTLTNATKSTKLGGSTIAGTQRYRWAKNAARSVVSYDEKGRKGILGRRGWGKTHSVTYRDDFTDYGYGDSKTYSDEMTDLRDAPESPPQHERMGGGYRDRDVQEYKREKPARVGGLNRIPDGSHLGGGGATNTDGSDLYSDSDPHTHNPSPTKHRERDRDSHDDKDRAERRARAEAAKMERRWKREAEEAAAALARESAQQHQPPVPPHTATTTPPRKSATPSKPSASRNRSASPKKRDFSYQTGPGSEQLSTAASYTATQTTTTDRTASSYYDAYRPRGVSGNQSGQARYATDRRQSSPAKKGGRGDGGYRRGADSDLD